MPDLERLTRELRISVTNDPIAKQKLIDKFNKQDKIRRIIAIGVTLIAALAIQFVWIIPLLYNAQT